MEPLEPPRRFQAARKSVPRPRLPGGTEALEPKEVSQIERIFTIRGSVLRWTDGTLLCDCRLGVNLSSILAVLPNTTQHTPSGSYETHTPSFSLLFDIFKDLNYILYFDARTNTILIALKKHHQATYLQAWFHAFLLVRYLRVETLKEQIDRNFGAYEGWGDVPVEETEQEKILWRALLVTASYVGRQWGNVWEELESARWDLGVDAMVTVGSRTSFRIRSDGDTEEEIKSEDSAESEDSE